jgi:hypothetical protein
MKDLFKNLKYFKNSLQRNLYPIWLKLKVMNIFSKNFPIIVGSMFIFASGLYSHSLNISTEPINKILFASFISKNEILLQLILKDSDQGSLPKLIKVEFDSEEIPLHIKDLSANRGEIILRKPPGKYKLKWKVDLGRYTIPRYQTYEQFLILDPNDQYLEIEIIGSNVQLS